MRSIVVLKVLKLSAWLGVTEGVIENFFTKFLHFKLNSDNIRKVLRKDYIMFIRQGGAKMAKCAICGKGAYFGNMVSHSHRRSNKVWKANVKSVRVKTPEGNKRMYVCTSCLRSGKVERV